MENSLAAIQLSEPVPKLLLIERLLQALHKLEIKYCHWKSSEHLNASMVADTDLDILFDEKEKPRLETLFKSLGFKKFVPIKQRQYRDIEDLIGLDLTSGKIIHLHAHFRLTLGESYLKGYQLSLEHKILNSRVFDDVFGIYRIDPAFELILLFFRQALKVRTRDVLKMKWKNQLTYNEAVLKEYKWLKERCTDKEVQTLLKALIKHHEPVYKLIIGGFNRRQVHKLAPLLRREFKRQRLFFPLQALALRWYREASLKLSQKMLKFLEKPIVTKRINDCGGLVIAVIGADGSGTSTVSENLQSTFSKKIDVYKIYLGKGRAGGLSWPRKLLATFRKNIISAKKRIRVSNEPKVEELGINIGIKPNLFSYIEALIVAYEKYKKLKKMQAARKKGMLVICDRYPQNQVLGYNDGPVLQNLSTSKNFLLRAMSRSEASVYQYAEKHAPDVVFKLVADAHVIKTRKPRMVGADILQTKVDGIKALHFPKSHMVTIDAAQPLTDVLQAIKKEIWMAYK